MPTTPLNPFLLIYQGSIKVLSIDIDKAPWHAKYVLEEPEAVSPSTSTNKTWRSTITLEEEVQVFIHLPGCLGGVMQLVNGHSTVGIEEEHIKTLHTSEEEEGTKTSHTHPQPRLFLILFILLTLALLLILLLSSYAVYLMGNLAISYMHYFKC